MPELPELDSILHSGQLAYGKYTREFEQRLENFIGCSQGHMLATNSCNMAIGVRTSLW